jgi:hypothetical protein
LVYCTSHGNSNGGCGDRRNGKQIIQCLDSTIQQVFNGNYRYAFLSEIHPAEVFPLLLSKAVMVQGLVFLGIEGTGFKSITIKGCRPSSDAVWVALWIVPYLLAVFGLETMFRSIKNPRFPARSKFNVGVCISIVFVMLALTFIPAKINPPKEKCIASVIYQLKSFGTIGLILLTVVMIAITFSAGLTFMHLSKSVKIDRDERIAGTRIVYYLLVNALTLVCLQLVLSSCSLLTCSRHLFFRFSYSRLWVIKSGLPYP